MSADEQRTGPPAYEPPAVVEIDITEGPCETIAMIASGPA